MRSLYTWWFYTAWQHIHNVSTHYPSHNMTWQVSTAHHWRHMPSIFPVPFRQLHILAHCRNTCRDLHSIPTHNRPQSASNTYMSVFGVLTFKGSRSHRYKTPQTFYLHGTYSTTIAHTHTAFCWHLTLHNAHTLHAATHSTTRVRTTSNGAHTAIGPPVCCVICYLRIPTQDNIT